ncbi:MAG: glycosyltransferase [Fibrobacterota bacterium]
MISVAMATCQGERWISAQLWSILEQLGPHDEIVVADAQSADRTLEIARDLCKDKVRVLEGLPRGDIPGSFEAALRHCKGDTIFLADQDDVWLSGKVDKCCRALEGASSLVLHDARVVAANKRILSESFLGARGFKAGYWNNLLRPGYLGCATAMRRELLEKALPFPAGLPMHDWWLGLLAERLGGVALLREPLLLHRRHGGNANFDPNRSPYSMLQRLVFRWRIHRDVKFRLKERS